MSKATDAFVEAVFRKQSTYAGGGLAHYDQEKDVSYGYTHHPRTCPIITVYWSKDLVVLSDCGVKDLRTFKLLNMLLPNDIKLIKVKGQYFLKALHFKPRTFLWSGSQALSLSQHYKLYNSPQGIAHITGGAHINLTLTRPIKVVTVERAGRVWSVVAYELQKSWRQGGWGRRSEWIIYWGNRDHVAQSTATKEEAELIAQRYSIKHQVPYVEYTSLFKRGYWDVAVKFT